MACVSGDLALGCADATCQDAHDVRRHTMRADHVFRVYSVLGIHKLLCFNEVNAHP